jgi:hypothetical protein
VCLDGQSQTKKPAITRWLFRTQGETYSTSLTFPALKVTFMSL